MFRHRKSVFIAQIYGLIKITGIKPISMAKPRLNKNALRHQVDAVIYTESH
ncbi:hypothetical protein Echvi_1803 [Echinicola vietnamensis DSM 17526]|uniref:Uncharacterized protein n=1 Tax=Echinicola vietnamensis (strain DSM 17526 / LMG 23754 / KMM 6221) TaxID=926556 RepID=L0FXQ3_ECHVK|nr:hypothetical protein Echvi_1803 [Echinicola vietnamensis DSM 17526]